MLILQIIVYFVVFADIAIARTVVCFLYLMLVPGIVILRLLRLENLDIAEKALFSAGLSIAFLMFIGLIINEIARLALTSPLSLNLLIISINTTVLLMSFIGARRDSLSMAPTLQLKHSKSLFLVLLSVSLLLLGSYGIIVVNTSGNSLFLLLLIFTISIIISLVFLSEKIIPSNYYPLILLVICICMLFFVSSNTSLITKYITGNGDLYPEYYAFKLTEINRFWNSGLAASPYNSGLFPTYSMISVTIMPLIFSTITGLDSSSIFKLLYPLVVSFIALGTYKLYQTQTDRKAAFVATFFLITISVGKGWGSSKQEVAQLFYVSLFLLLFKKDISASKRNVLFIILGASLVISHYALSYIFLLTILLEFLILTLMNYRRTSSINQTKMPLALVLILLTITFSWYIFVNSSATFNLLIDEVNTVTSNLGQFFNPESRGTALQGLGVVQTTSIFNSISSAFFILTEFLLVLGFIKLITSKDKTSRFSIEYKVIAAINMAIIAMNILLPTIADTFLMSRFYQTTLIILAPLAVLGGKTIIELVPKPNFRKLYAPLLVFMVFIPLFLFQTGFVFEVTKVQSTSLPLSMYRWNDLELYGYIVNAQEVAGSQWIPKHANITNIFIYSDSVSRYNVLTSYGMMERGRIGYLLNTTRPTSNELIYLANTNLISKGYIFNTTEISPIVENQNKIYSNGECEIYRGYTP
jgi:uncharacterized membrane protein